MNIFTNEWEVWVDENTSPIIAKWLMEEIKIKCISFHYLKLNKIPDEDIYKLAKSKQKVIILSKDNDFRNLVSWKGSPPKLIAINLSNCSNRYLWQTLRSQIYDAIDSLIFGDLDIFDIK
ncbi:DUF5615 family PIN-like protein [Pedobacter endophyticus]|uniref:DUF5615 family PIN-like protein n=1 Tax=Pedobacter endophyticus TaxID=2789740 RepID=A0A7S9Q0A0_9SPHI|nr:DUF5615 family PIN-like protein [Pedobacter endophyticus]QPH40447.1 DUF5615 family PIN-like protein [Pedobacter endophyticus]